MKPHSPTPTPQQIAGMLVRRGKNGNTHPDRAAREGDLVRVAKGVYLDADALLRLNTKWQREIVVTTARALATADRMEDVHFIGRTAAQIRGIGTLGYDQDIQIWTPRRNNGELSRFPAVVVDGRLLAPGAQIKRHSGLVLGNLITAESHTYSGLEVPSLHSTLVTSALTLSSPESFVIASAGLRQLSQFDPFTQYRSRPLEAQARESLLAALDELPPRTRLIRRARWVFENADAGCDNVAEAWLLHTLLEAGFVGTKTQFEVRVEGSRFFIDIAIPDVLAAGEFDGEVKKGVDAQGAHEEAQRREHRQRILESLGYVVVRVTWRELLDPDAVVAKVRSAVAKAGRRLHLLAA